ncbi:aldo/keto reductase [Petroclostridium sp. X23]|uniref:aldo/keto reductase n=1 Tax=Petroclostridium sp. X23 TaxID=3045146 RepID=UPI0024ACA77B|nr:aldo/keto reductase [Petroclostridium sp. X23]WHH58105.1 aldo/keto reductase [Petroclostridium sp. X23]
MRYKKFGKTGEDLSVICLGTWTLGGKNFGAVAEKDAIQAIDAMIDSGVNFIDTAPIYADGDSERILGKALKGKRDKIFLVSKFGSYFPENRPRELGTVRDSSRGYILKAIDETLSRLNTDYLDGYLIHWPDPKTPLEETVGTLKELQKAGKVRYIGMSNFDEPLADKLVELDGLDIAQYPYSMVNRTREDLLKKYHAKGVGTMGYASLGAGILTGTIRTLPNYAKDDMRNVFYDYFREPKFSKIMELLKTLDEIAEERNVPMAQIAVNWSIQKDYIDTALTGVRDAREAVENCAAASWELAAEEIAKIDDAIENTIGK